MNNNDFDKKLSDCVVCHSKNISDYLVDHNGVNISRCDKCGFQFMNPQYTDEYLTEYYSKYTGPDDFDYWYEASLYGLDYYLSLIERYCGRGKMLDIGCGHGYFLEVGLKRGWTVRGYDVDEDATQVVANRLDVTVDNGDFCETDFGEDYDLVTMHQVLEHLKTPNEYLQKAHSLLSKDGFIFVAVPNIKSLANRFKRFLERIGVRRKNIGKYYDTSHHVLYFEPETLTAILKNNGFEVVYQRNCHSTRSNQSAIPRFMMRNFLDHLFAKSAFLVIAKKVRASK